MATITLTIDGVHVETRNGVTVLEAAQEAGIYIPTLCSDPDLEPYGGCRLCIVEIENVPGLLTACTTPATDGMIAYSDRPAVNKVRRDTVALLLADYPADCLVCNEDQQCDLHRVATYLGITERPFRRLNRSLPIDSSNPFFNRDLNHCILCGKCVRACDEVAGVAAIEISSRGYTSLPSTFGDRPLIQSTCISCGECLIRCPTSALIPKEIYRPEQKVKSTCPYCGVGCQIYLGIKDGRITVIHGDRDNDVNRGRLCVKGRFGIVEFVRHPERLTTPLVRRNGELVEATWGEALELIANTLSEYEKGEVAVISSAKCTNEDNYVIQKFARAVLGTNDVDHCARLCHAPTVAGLAKSFGSGAMTNSITDISGARCILAIGTNTTEAHPVIGFDVKKAVRGGTKLIVANPRWIELCRSADLWLRLLLGSDVALLMGMMRVIVDEGLLDRSFVEDRCENFDAFIESLNSFDLGFVERTTGVPREQIVEAAWLYATNSPAAILYAMGITQHSHGTDNVIAVANLAMLTGNIGKPASGVNPLRGHNNVQGSCDMGALPNVYPGYQAVSDLAVREKFEDAWGCSLDHSPGLTLTEIFDVAYQGQIKALYLVGENPVLSDPDAKHVREALAKLEFLVVQDVFLTETAQLAHVVLPGTTFAEKDGTFTNTERRVQRVRKAIEPVGNSRPDWWVTCQIARRMGSQGFDFSHPSQIMDEIASLTPSYGGISYNRLEDGGLQWPCPTHEHPGTPILHAGQFTRGKGRFMPLEYKPPVELTDDDYPLLLTTGRSLYHFHTGTLTRKVRGLNILDPEGLVEINPGDALALDISDGELVRVISRRGKITARAKMTESSPPGVVAMTFHFGESPTNFLTNPSLDPLAKIPELKVCAVRVEKSTG